MTLREYFYQQGIDQGISQSITQGVNQGRLLEARRMADILLNEDTYPKD